MQFFNQFAMFQDVPVLKKSLAILCQDVVDPHLVDPASNSALGMCQKYPKVRTEKVYQMCGRTSIYHPMVNHSAPLKQEIKVPWGTYRNL